MKWASFIFVLLTFNLSRSQIHFPTDTSTPFNYEMYPPRQGGPVYDNDVDGVITRGVMKLTLSIAKTMSNRQLNSDNVVYAPINIAAILALILLGANGKTFDEVSDILGLSSGLDIHSRSQQVHEQLGRLFSRIDQSSPFNVGEEVRLASALFVQDDFPIRSLYKQISETVYRSEVLNVDFQADPENARSVINAWVGERTNGKIERILAEDPPTTTKVIIVGALYFKAAWEKPFFQGVTKRRPFFPDGRNAKTTSRTVEMMSNGGLFPYYKDSALDCEILGFPYKGNRTTMYVVMPGNSDKQKLLDLQNRLTPEDLERLVDNTRYTQTVILFPKMKLESSFDLTKSLRELGVKSLFVQSQANLALLSPGRSFNSAASSPGGFVSNVVKNPISAGNDFESVLIFSRSGVPLNCTKIFDPAANVSRCEQVDEATNKQVVYKKFGEKVGRRIARSPWRTNINRWPRQDNPSSLDALRSELTVDDNPGLYVDQVLHKVYMEITETGTEAAAATSVSLSRGGDITTFRVDQPFLFFIRNHDTKAVLFWGAVNTPTPSFS